MTTHVWERLPRNLEDVTALDAPRRLGALLVGARNGGLYNESVPPKTVAKGYGIQEAGKIAFVAWLCAASSAETDPTKWADAAVVGALVGAGNVKLEWLRDRPRFTGDQFDTPTAWAQAEWNTQWEERAREWASTWTAKIPSAKRWMVVRRVLRGNDSDAERRIVDRLTRLYPGTIENGIVTLAAPKPVAEWVGSAVFNMSAQPNIEATWFGDATAEEHSIAVRLWATDSNGALSTYDDALQAARAVLN